MTLVLTVHGRDTLWVLVDRRLSYRGRPPVDAAVKLMNLETSDGVALLAYAGLGATARGSEPSEWMSGVLRGRGGLTLEQCLGVLADVATKELPSHIVRTAAGIHSIVIPAFVTGAGARLYTIDNAVDRRTRSHHYRYTRHVRGPVGSIPGPDAPSIRLALAGTGGLYLGHKQELWRRRLLRLVKAHDRGRIPARVVADELARLNLQAHQGVRDGSVGPTCIVVWRRRRDARIPGPGGEHQFYSGVERTEDSGFIPTISNGMDVRGIAGLMMTMLEQQASEPGFFERGLVIDEDEMNRRLGELPHAPDDQLR